MKYLPFLNGTYSTAPGLLPIARQEIAADQLIFQIDEQYNSYRANKTDCRAEDIRKYYLEHDYAPSTRRVINNWLVKQLVQEYPGQFDLAITGDNSIFINLQSGEIIQWDTESQVLAGSAYLSLFDALANQVQEDLAVCQLQETRDWLAAIHLCAPNHWAAGDKVGKPFDSIHAPVPGMEKTINGYFKMLQSLVVKGPFTRFAWGISTDQQLNHHPVPPPGITAKEWQGRMIDDQAELFIRTERQNLVGFPKENAFLFTIRTYFYPVDALTAFEKTALWSAVRSMSPASLAYKGLTDVTGYLVKRLFPEEY